MQARHFELYAEPAELRQKIYTSLVMKMKKINCVLKYGGEKEIFYNLYAQWEEKRTIAYCFWNFKMNSGCYKYILSDILPLLHHCRLYWNGWVHCFRHRNHSSWWTWTLNRKSADCRELPNHEYYSAQLLSLQRMLNEIWYSRSTPQARRINQCRATVVPVCRAAWQMLSCQNFSSSKIIDLI